MKSLKQCFNFFIISLLCGVFYISCTSDEPGAAPDPKDSVGTFSTNADTISNHLQFFNATKIQGTIPGGPAGSSLKISFEDTLYLTGELKVPVKFLHEDITENVAGIYVQVHGAATGGTGGIFNAAYYYDIPELQDAAESDTVSIIMIGVDPVGLIDIDGVPPAGSPSLVFDMTIVPYDKSGKPIAEDIRPVKIKESNDDPNGNNGLCGLVLPRGDFWDWKQSDIENPDYHVGLDPNVISPFSFATYPNVPIFDAGQDIKGNCCDGISTYGFCATGDTTLNASLHFPTYYQIASETLVFSDDGTYERNTIEYTAVPLPGESDFCGGGSGVVKNRIDHITYYGNWTVNSINAPQDLGGGTRNHLTLQTTSSNGLGFGNPGGIINVLNCDVLYLIQIDREGFGQHLYKYYERRSLGDEDWYPFA